jgi:glycosyltransferase involved in cell wall biosynthesis
MSNGLRVIMLLTDGFGGRGGIAKFNRDFLQALDGCGLVERVQALPRKIPSPIDEPIPEIVVYDRKAARGKAAFLLRVVAHAWRDRETDLVVCGHIHLLPLAWLLARLRGARLALIVHGVEAWQPSRKILANWLSRRVDAIISVSKYTAERFTHWSKLPMDRVFILPNCVDLGQFKPQQRDAGLVERYGLQSNKVIMTVGRLASEERYRGFDQVIDLMPQLIKRFSNIKYLIVGEGNDRSRLEAKVEALGLSNRVIFTGYVSESEKIGHYNLADVYISPSTGEGFGIVLLEAVACGVPVVSSGVGGSREALLDGELGRLVDASDPPELLAAVASALEGGKAPQRMEMINTFSVQNFRTRVVAWCQVQASGVHRCSE